MYFLLFIATAIIIFSCIEGSARTKRNLNLLNKINKNDKNEITNKKS